MTAHDDGAVTHEATTPPTTTTIKDITILIIGGGLAGLSLAMGLGSSPSLRERIHVHLVEKVFDWDAKRGATFGVMPNGMKSLEELSNGNGLVEELKEVGVETFGGDGLMLPWYRVRDGLLSKVRNLEGQTVTMHTGLSICRIVDDDDSPSVKAFFRPTEGKDGEEQEEEICLEAQVLIGADGVHSAVRQLLGLAPSYESGRRVCRGRAWVKSPDSKLFPLLGKGLLPLGHKTYQGRTLVVFNYHPKFDGLLAWTASSEKDLTPQDFFLHCAAPDDADGEVISALFAESTVDAEKFTPTKLVNIGEVGWGLGTGRCTVIGDAAHAMRPTDGQGGAMAFEDGVMLCRLLTDKIDNDWGNNRVACCDLLRQLEASRIDRVTRVWRVQEERYQARVRGEKVSALDDEFQTWLHGGI